MDVFTCSLQLGETRPFAQKSICTRVALRVCIFLSMMCHELRRLFVTIFVVPLGSLVRGIYDVAMVTLLYISLLDTRFYGTRIDLSKLNYIK